MMALMLVAEPGVDLNNLYGIIIQSGVIGVFLILFLIGKVRRESELKDLKADKDKEIAELKASLKDYTSHYQDDVVPALIDVTKVAGELVAYLNKHRD